MCLLHQNTILHFEDLQNVPVMNSVLKTKVCFQKNVPTSIDSPGFFYTPKPVTPTAVIMQIYEGNSTALHCPLRRNTVVRPRYSYLSFSHISLAPMYQLHTEFIFKCEPPPVSRGARISHVASLQLCILTRMNFSRAFIVSGTNCRRDNSCLKEIRC